jgi:hypothetical protein
MTVDQLAQLIRDEAFGCDHGAHFLRTDVSRHVAERLMAKVLGPLRLRAMSVVQHWNEFGPEHNFEEEVHWLEKALNEMDGR